MTKTMTRSVVTALLLAGAAVPIRAQAPLTSPTPSPAPFVRVAQASPVPPLPPVAPMTSVPPLPALPSAAPWVSLDWHQLDAEMFKLRGALSDMKFDFAYPERDFERNTSRAFADQAQVYVDARRIGGREQAEGLLEQARALIEQDRYDRALQSLDRVIVAGGTNVEPAMYWKAYSLAKLSRRPDALTTLVDMQKQFPKGRWLRDAQALEVEVRQAAGQSVNADAQVDEELKLLALRALMQSDPDTALPVIEKMLAGSSSVRVKDRALFVVSQSKSARARALVLGVAKGNANPDLQLKAIRYTGQMGGPESAQALDEVYRATGDERLKREILRSFMVSGARDKLLALARAESSAELRGDAVRGLGSMGAATELEQLYRAETSAEVKRRILQAMQAGGHLDKLAAIARSEADLDLRRTAIRNLGVTGRPEATDTLKAIYAAESNADVRKAVIEALALHANARALVDLARAEKDPALKAQIVRQLSVMRAPEARDYMLELLK